MGKSIAELKKEADIDVSFDTDRLDIFSTDLPKLTNKWNQYYLDEKLVCESIQIKYDKLYVKKYEHYLRDYHLTLDKRGGELDAYLRGDPELSEVRFRLQASKEKLGFIEDTKKNLQTSSFNIRNAIEWRKFMEGY